MDVLIIFVLKILHNTDNELSQSCNNNNTLTHILVSNENAFDINVSCKILGH